MRALALFAVMLISVSALGFAQSVFHPASEVANGTFGSSVGGGNYTFNNSLVINDNLGIGTLAPAEKLVVNGTLRVNNATGSAVLVVSATSGNVGIGTATPSQKLTVNGSVNITGVLYGNSTYLGSINTSLNTTGVVGYWHLDDGSGTNALDSNGGVKNGTLVNSPVWNSSAKVGPYALTFNGADQHVSIGALGIDNSDKNVTLSAWVYLSSSNYGTIIGDGDGAWANYQRFYVYLGYNLGYFFIAQGKAQYSGKYVFSSQYTTLNKWYYVVGTVNGVTGDMHIYVNGMRDDNVIGGTYTSGIAHDLWEVGAVHNSYTTPVYSDFFNGTIDEALVENRVASAPEIAGSYLSVNTPNTLAVTSNSWVGGDAYVAGDARTYGNGYITGNLTVSGSLIGGNAFFEAQDQKASGVAAQACVSGSWFARNLTIALTNEISEASLSNNNIILPAGTYYVTAETSVIGSGGDRLRLYNLNDSAALVYGLNGYSYSNTYHTSTDSSYLAGRFTLTGTKTLSLQHYVISCSNLGVAMSLAGINETYTDISIWKIR